jgi:hypothetical protein
MWSEIGQPSTAHRDSGPFGTYAAARGTAVMVEHASDIVTEAA